MKILSIALLFILAISVGLNIYLYFYEIKKAEKVFFFDKHMVKIRGNYLRAYWKIPDDCDEIIGAELRYISKGIVRKH